MRLPASTAALVIALTPIATATAATTLAQREGRAVLDLARTTAPPRVDGRLDDQAWRVAPLDLPEWVTYNPAPGQRIPQRTDVRVVYDDTAIYFAFHCVDPEPDRVRATLSRRDQLFNDDWVGLSLDAIGNRQQSYDLFVNPLGVQADILNTSTAGETISPDWVWDSAARPTPEGYDVEIRLPWKSIRFSSGADVRMNVLFWRRVSRTGTSASWPELPREKPFFENHAPMFLRDLRRPLALEVVPSATYSWNEERATPTSFAKADGRPEVGASVKYGVTSTTTVEATVNPDFSQVESDAFQVEVNQRYPVFYSEKRPFFMEGLGTFELAGTGGDGNMRTAVHTRRIVDPVWGAKSSGTVGKLSFATLAAADAGAGNALDAAPLVQGERELFLIGRATWGLGRGSYVGAIATDTELASGHNRVVGGDLSLRRGAHSLSGTFLASRSLSLDGADGTRGVAAQAFYAYDTKRYTLVTQTEHYDRGFRMDTAFYNQTGITTNWSFAQVSFYPDEKKHGWIKKVQPFVFTRLGRDRVQGGDVRLGLVGIRASFTRQGYFRVDTHRAREPWAGREFPTRQTRVMTGAQILRWLNVDARLEAGRSVYYDAAEPFAGPSWSHSVSATVQPGASFSQNVSWDRYQLDRPDGAGRAFRVDVLNLRTSYQFDRRFALRAIVRWDSDAKRVLTDLLASFEPVPGTVAYAGYGSLIEQRAWSGEGWLPGQGDYLTTRRGLFFKASYAKRF